MAVLHGISNGEAVRQLTQREGGEAHLAPLLDDVPGPCEELDPFVEAQLELRDVLEVEGAQRNGLLSGARLLRLARSDLRGLGGRKSGCAASF